MNILRVLALVVIALLLVLMVVNWPVLSAPATLNLLIGRVQWPLGLSLIAVSVLLLGGVMVSGALRRSRVVDVRMLRADLLARIDAMERTLIQHLDETHGSICAHTGEIDHKLDQLAASSGHPLPPP